MDGLSAGDETLDATRREMRRRILLIAAVVVGALAAVVALIQWDLSRECVRWSTRIDIDDLGRVSRTKVCAESRPRGQYGEEPPFDLRGPKGR